MFGTGTKSLENYNVYKFYNRPILFFYFWSFNPSSSCFKCFYNLLSKIEVTSSQKQNIRYFPLSLFRNFSINFVQILALSTTLPQSITNFNCLLNSFYCSVNNFSSFFSFSLSIDKKKIIHLLDLSYAWLVFYTHPIKFFFISWWSW